MSTNAQASPALKEKQPPPTTALTAPAFLETLWTRLRKVQPTLPATLWRTSLSIRQATRGFNMPLLVSKLSGRFSPFNVFMLLSNYLLKRECQVLRKESCRSWAYRQRRFEIRLSTILRTWLDIESCADVSKNRQCTRNPRHLGHTIGTTFSFTFSFVSCAPKVSRRARGDNPKSGPMYSSKQGIEPVVFTERTEP